MDVTSEDDVTDGVATTVAAFGGVDILVSNAGIQIVHPLEEFTYAEWKKMLAIHLDGAFLTTRACLPHMYKCRPRRQRHLHGLGAFAGGVAAQGAVRHGQARTHRACARSIAKEGAKHGVRANVICPGFVRTPLVDKQIPEQAQQFGITEDDVIRKIMLKDTVDGEFTTLDDIAEVALFFAAFPTNALTGQSLVASHGWHMQ